MFYIVFVSLFLFNVFLVQNYSYLNCGYNGLRAHGRVKHFLEKNQDCVSEWFNKLDGVGPVDNRPSTD